MLAFLFTVMFLVAISTSAAQKTCNNKPCYYGECVKVSGVFKCRCLQGFTGPTCSEVLNPGEDPCVRYRLCKNNGVCLTTGIFGNFDINAKFCLCINDYTGKYCEMKIPLCQRERPCLNGGSCVNNKCICAPNYFGNNCDQLRRYVRVKNKAAFIAKVGLGYYSSSFESKIESQTLWSLQSHEFKYDIQSVATVLYSSAVARRDYFYVDLFTDKIVCVDIYGTIFNPKATRVNC